MNIKKLLSIVIGLFIGSGLLYYAFVDGPSTPEIVKQVDSIEAMEQEAIEVNAGDVPDAKTSESLEIDTTIQKQLEAITDSFIQMNKFPAYSIPVQGEQYFDFDTRLNVNSASIPYTDQFGNDLSINAALDKKVYFTGDTLTAQADVIGVASNSKVLLESLLTNLETGQSQRVTFELMEGVDKFSYILKQPLSELDTALLKGEVVLNINAYVNGENFQNALVFRYTQPSATLIGVGNANPNEEYLEIPLLFDIEESGYYFVGAILIDENTRKALIDLHAEGRLSESNETLTLRAHISALKASGSEGPYELVRLNIRRGAEDNEEFDVPGNIASRSFKVPGFEFDRYLDKAYSDPLVQERAEFLRHLSGKKDGE